LCGLGIEPRNRPVRSADTLKDVGRQRRARRQRETGQDSAWSETPGTHERSLRRNWDVPRLTPSDGGGKPETFDFLGFTHICGRTRKNGRFMVVRRPMRTRVRAKLRDIHQDLRRRMHRPVRETGTWFKTVLEGWYRYYAVPTAWRVLRAFRSRLGWLWRRVLNRRSQRGSVPWETMYRLIDRWLPPPRILHPYPWERLRVRTQGKSPVR